MRILRSLGACLSPAIVVIAACGSTSSATSVPCAPRGGSFRIDLVEKSGNCGALVAQTFTMDPAGTLKSGCVGHEESPAADNCTATLKVSCPAGTGYQFLLSGTPSWSEDGKMGSGQVQVDVQASNGSYPCTSTYEATFTRQ